MWAKYFLAQHYDTVGEYDKAHELIVQVIKHTPTLIEAYLTQAAILKVGFIFILFIFYLSLFSN